MKKALKFLLWTVLGVLFLVLALVLTIPLWISPVAATAANKITPIFTGTPFSLDGVGVNPYTGKYGITKLDLGNPAGYPVPTAFSVSSVQLDVDMASLLSETIHIREVSIVAPYASYVSKDGVNNFEWIAAHVKSKIGPKDDDDDDDESKKKVVIDKLTIADTRVKLKMLPEMPIPTITLTDIGKDKGGATWEEVGKALVDAITKATTSVGEGLTSALGAIGDGAGAVVGSATNLLGSASSVVGGAATNVLGSATDVLGGAATNVLGGASGAIGGATKAIGESAKKLGNLGGLLGGDDSAKTSETNKPTAKESSDSGKSVGQGVLDAGKSLGEGTLNTGRAIGEGLKKLNPFGK